MKTLTALFWALRLVWGVCALLSSTQVIWSQNLIGGETGNPTAILELQSTNKGLLIPRMTSADRSAITNPAQGLMVFNTTLNCLEINLGSSSIPNWMCLLGGGRISSLACGSAVIAGSITEGIAVSGVSVSIPYTGADGGFHSGQVVSSTGVTGLTATLTAGTLAVGSGSLIYTITGTPSNDGTAGFALAIGGQDCTLSVAVNELLGAVSALNCDGAINSGTLTASIAASSVSSSVPYSGGNGGNYTGQSVASTGVTGLTATLTAGTFASGSGSLIYTITGTPSAAGTASFALNIGGQSCILSRVVSAPVGTISSLNCAGATNSGTLLPGVAASSVSSSVPYSGGNGGNYTGQSVASTGVTGLTATLTAGTFASGSSSLFYTITGTPSGAGTASFVLSIGGQSCTLQRTVVAIPTCAVFTAIGVTAQFMCHNLGADLSANHLTPSWELVGNYYQWGRNPSCFGRDGIDGTNPCSSPVYGAEAPWGNTSANDNSGSINGWSTIVAGDGDWLDGSKTTNDPCPPGFRVPTRSQWNGVLNQGLQAQTFVGTWTASPTNYSSGVRFGSTLFLPAAGRRDPNTGLLEVRGSEGFYWSSTQDGTTGAWPLTFNSSSASTGSFSWGRNRGFSVRCVAL